MSKNTRSLTVFSLVMINVIAIDNLRSLPFGAVFGPSLWLYYLLAALCFFLPTAYVTAELATAWPNRGGIYVWVREAFGAQWGFLVIWFQWLCNILWYPAMLMFLSAVIADWWHPAWLKTTLYQWLMVVSMFAGASLINLRGMRLSSGFSTLTALVGTLLPMACIIGCGVWWAWTHSTHTINWLRNDWMIHPIRDAHSMPALLGLVFGLVGIEMSAVHAEEVKEPKHAYPRAILWSSLLILSSLIAASLAIVLVVPADQINWISGVNQALVAFFKVLHLTAWLPLMFFLIILGGIGNLSTWIIGPSKGLMVAIWDGSAPACLGRVNRFDVPVVLIAIQFLAVMILATLLYLLPLEAVYTLLTVMAAQWSLWVYVMLFLAMRQLRIRYPNHKRSYRIPGGQLGMNLCVWLGIITCSALFFVGFIPPDSVPIGRVWVYETTLCLGMLLMLLLPFGLMRLANRTF
jgi:glutamate:GABA antiporter